MFDPDAHMPRINRTLATAQRTPDCLLFADDLLGKPPTGWMSTLPRSRQLKR